MIVSLPRALRLCGAVFAALSACLIAAPGVIYGLFDLDGGDAANVLSKRAGVLFAGLAYLMVASASHPPSPSGRSVGAAVCLILGGLAGLGAVEWARGAVGPGILIAVVVECVLGGLLWVAVRRDVHMTQVTGANS